MITRIIALGNAIIMLRGARTTGLLPSQIRSIGSVTRFSRRQIVGRDQVRLGCDRRPTGGRLF
jgi:hypothetical protein